MKDKTKFFLFALGLVIPALLIFKTIFSLNTLAWGDAVHFYKENFEELTSLPQAWVNRENNFGGINRVIWLYPLMLALGFLGKIGFSSEMAMRIIFYFPAVAISFLSAMFFAKKLGHSLKVQFFTSLVYSLNTYFLLLIDGGQSGVFLAYALFPLPLLYLKKLLGEGGNKNFALSFLLLTLLILADPRVAVVCIIALFLWLILETIFLKKTPLVKNFLSLILLLFFETLISLYWLIPLLVFGEGNVSAHVSTLQLSSLLNSLLIYQPHWPQNIFGVVTFPPFYFVLIPALVLGGLLVKPVKKDFIFALIFLSFVFLAKGETPPLGGIYKFVIEKVPFGISLRDSTKFFIPLLLFGGLLIGLFIEKVKSKFLMPAVYFYLLFLVSPALIGNLNGNLKIRSYSSDFVKFYEKIRNEKGSVRSLWFPERHALSFQTEVKPALDAKNLVELTPFAFFNEGTHDKFNFMNKEDYLEWFRLLGVRYLIFSGNPRLEDLSEEEAKDWENLKRLVATTSGLIRVDWDVTFPVYKLEDVKPRVFATDKLLLVVGGMEGTADLINDSVVAYAEDGMFNARELKDKEPNSVAIVFNDKGREDLAFSLLQDNFLATPKASLNEWANFTPDQYLDWKYQLLIRGVDVKDLDYQKGISFSTQKGERIEFHLDIDSQGEYLLAVRGVGEEDRALGFSLGETEGEISLEEGALSWTKVKLPLRAGRQTLVFENRGGLQVINVALVVPKEKWDEAEGASQSLLERFPTLKLTDVDEKGTWHEVDYEIISPTEYKVLSVPDGNWLVFTDTYNESWEFAGEAPHPIYTMLNGFYLGGAETGIIYFKGQNVVDKAGYISLAVLGLLAGVFVLRKPWKK